MAATKKHAGSPTDAVEATSKEAERAEATHEKLLDREKKALEHLESLKTRAKGSDSKRLASSVLSARQRASETTKLRREAAARVRDLKKLVREEQQLAREAERKDRARERAVAAFLRKWEREYDLEMQRKKKNIKLRKRELENR